MITPLVHYSEPMSARPCPGVFQSAAEVLKLSGLLYARCSTCRSVTPLILGRRRVYG